MSLGIDHLVAAILLASSSAVIGHKVGKDACQDKDLRRPGKDKDKNRRRVEGDGRR
jgi:hypothetical protein